MKRKLFITSLLFCICSFLYANTISAEINNSQNVTSNATVLDGSDDEYQVDVTLSASDTSYFTYDKMDVVLLIDTSASMAGEPLKSAKESAIAFSDSILEKSAENQISVISYNSQVTVGTHLSNKKEDVENAILNLKESGLTHTNLGIDATNEELKNYGRPNAHKVVIILADGFGTDTDDLNDAFTSTDALLETAPDVTIKTIGYNISSDTIEERFLERIAEKDTTTGEYYNALTTDLSTVFDNIISSFVAGVDEASVKIKLPTTLNFVEDSFIGDEGITYDFSLIDIGFIIATITNPKATDNYHFSYKVKIDQENSLKQDDIKNNYISHSFIYVSGDERIEEEEVPSFPIYKIITASDENGTISASRCVGKGAQYHATWAANEGYLFDHFSLNDTVIPTTSNDYLLENISDDNYLDVSFKKDPTNNDNSNSGNSDTNNMNNNQNKKDDIPQTSDTTQINLLITLASLSLLSIFLVYKKNTSH